MFDNLFGDSRTTKRYNKLVDDLFDSLENNGFGTFTKTTTISEAITPDTEMTVDSNGVRLLHLSLVGHNKDTVSINIDGEYLTVKSKDIELPRFAKKFVKKYKLVGKFNEDEISAVFKDGVLTISTKFIEDKPTVKEVKIK